MRKKSRVNHQPDVRLENGNEPLVPPIYQSVKYSYEKLADMKKVFRGEQQGFVYSRIANPTTRRLELLLSEMQGTEDAIVVASGVAAITASLTALLKAGDHVVSFYESYRPTRIFITKILKRFGVDSTLVSVDDHDGYQQAFRPGKTRLVIFESPTNPVLKIADIEFLTATAKTHGALVIMDNTFAGLHNHHGVAVDLYIQSLTKFAVGHGDAMGGAILGSKKLLDSLRWDIIELGPVLAPDSANLILRGLKTYYLRLEKQCQNALVLAKRLAENPRLTNLSYPGLPSHPQHQLAARQMPDFGALMAFDLKGPPENLETFIDSLRCIRLAASLGSTETLIAPCELFFANDLSPEERRIARINPLTLRLSVGIEEVEDVLEDIEQALARCKA